jgi:hypothetical protein
MIETKCQWCKREIAVNHWEPLTNEAMITKPVICRACHIEYEAGWFSRLVKISIERKKENEI